MLDSSVCRSFHLQVSTLLERTALSVKGTVVMIFGLLVALSQLGFQIAPLLAGLGVAGFIVGFALQDTLSDLASGVMILLYRPYDVGDLVEAHDKVLEDPAPNIKLHTLNESSVDFVVRPWVATDDYWDVYWDITREVKIRFDAEKISIPFPQRDVHIFKEGVAGDE